jgi:hypothetical protein
MTPKEIVSELGIHRSIESLAEEHGIPSPALRARLKRGMSLEEALKAPVREYPRKITYNGESLTTREWAERCGTTREVFAERLRHHPIEEALKIPPTVRKPFSSAEKKAVAISIGQTYDIDGKKYRCDRIGQCAAGPLVIFTVIGPGVRETFTLAQLREVGLKVS